MLYILILILVWKKIPSVNSEPIIEPIFKKWIENFETIEKFSAFSKAKSLLRIPKIRLSNSLNSMLLNFQVQKVNQVVFHHTNLKLEQFFIRWVFSVGLPQGFGTLANVDYEGGNQKCCFKAMCKVRIVI